MLNYCTHAIEDFNRLLSIQSKTLNPSSPAYLDRLVLQELVELLRQSVKFHLPVNGEILDYSKAAEIVSKDIFHLPFPVCALEYEYTNFKPEMAAQGRIHVPRRIALCLEYEAISGTILGKTATKTVPEIETIGGIIMIPFFWAVVDGISSWAPTYAGVVALREDLESSPPSLFYSMDTYTGKPAMIKVGVTPTVVLPGLLNQYFNYANQSGEGASQVANQIMVDCAEEFYAMSNLMVALSCSNIGLQDQSAPTKLNKKRIQSGKEPMFGYKEVVVQVNKSDVAHSHDAMNGRSCREHLRRGHIRRLNGSEKRIWIQSTIVNAGKGPMVNKNYRIE